MNPSKDPPSGELTLVECQRYEWAGAYGALKTYVGKLGDRYFIVHHCDIKHDPASTNKREAGWEGQRDIDSHRYTSMLQRAAEWPPQVPADLYGPLSEPAQVPV